MTENKKNTQSQLRLLFAVYILFAFMGFFLASVYTVSVLDVGGF